MNKDPMEKGNEEQDSDDFEFEIIDDGKEYTLETNSDDKINNEEESAEEKAVIEESAKDEEVSIVGETNDSETNDVDANEVMDNDGEVVEDDSDEDEVDEDENSEKKHLTKNQIMNRIMVGGGVLIAGFTLFFGCVIYGALHKDSNDGEDEQNTEQATTVVEETTTEKKEEALFVSTNSDATIGENVKTLLNNASTQSLETGLYALDNRVNNVLATTCTKDMTMYEKVRNVYDYMMYYYDVTNKTYIDQDTIIEACSSVDYTSDFDMEVVYRANKLLTNQTGSSEDYACAFTVLLRKLGLEAYYIDGKMMGDNAESKSEGYTLVVIDGQRYLFDVAKEDTLSKNATVEYKVFCKTLDELTGQYSTDGIQDSINKFEGFAKLGKFSVNAIFTSGDYSAEGTVNYQNDSEDVNTVEANGNLEILLQDNISISASVKGSNKNTWKLIAKVYDSDMNYQTEAIVYNETTNTNSNEIIYTPGRAGNIKLLLMVTDSNGRTCTVYKTVVVSKHVIAAETDTQETTEEETTTVQETTTQPNPDLSGDDKDNKDNGASNDKTNTPPIGENENTEGAKSNSVDKKTP